MVSPRATGSRHREPSSLAANRRMVALLHELGVLTVPAGINIVRILPPLNLSMAEANELLERFDRAVALALA